LIGDDVLEEGVAEEDEDDEESNDEDSEEIDEDGYIVYSPQKVSNYYNPLI